MSESAWIALLTLAGGAFEIVGVPLVVREIAHARRSARELFPLEIHSAQSRISASAVILTTGEVEGERSMPERVANLEREFTELRPTTEATVRATKQEIHKAIDEKATELARKHVERDRALRRFITTRLTAGIGWRIAGVGFIVAGIVCTTAAGVCRWPMDCEGW